MINWLTPIFSAPAPGQFASEIKQKQSECDSYRNTNSVCDSVGDSLLPTSSAHTIIHFCNGPRAEDCRDRQPCPAQTMSGAWVCAWDGGVYGLERGAGGVRGGSEITPIIQQHTLTFRNTEHVCIMCHSAFVFCCYFYSLQSVVALLNILGVCVCFNNTIF